MPEWFAAKVAPVLIRWAVVAGVALACMGFGALKMHQHDQVAYDKLSAQFSEFRGAAKSAAADYAAKVAAKEKKDGEDKVRADKAHVRELADAYADLARLRAERDSARSGLFAQRPAGSKCPEGQICFDGAEYRAAYRGLVDGVRRAGDKGTKVEQALRNAMDWADGN